MITILWYTIDLGIEWMNVREYNLINCHYRPVGENHSVLEEMIDGSSGFDFDLVLENQGCAAYIDPYRAIRQQVRET
jgi:hypothetical protein